MKVGICCDAVSAVVAERAGAEYFEPTVTNTLTPDRDTPPAALKDLGRTSIKPEAFNVFLPPALKVTGPAVDMTALEAYVSRAFTRAASVGGSIIVFGSGPARTAPEGFPRERAMEQLREFLRMAARHASAAGITVAVEPLTKRESNIINTVAEARALTADIASPNVSVVADTYHMFEEGESPDVLSDAARTIVHFHVAEPEGRTPPKPGGRSLSDFLSVLKRSGYDGRISVECIWTDFAAEASDAVRAVREAWNAV